MASVEPTTTHVGLEYTIVGETAPSILLALPHTGQLPMPMRQQQPLWGIRVCESNISHWFTQMAAHAACLIAEFALAGLQNAPEDTTARSPRHSPAWTPRVQPPHHARQGWLLGIYTETLRSCSPPAPDGHADGIAKATCRAGLLMVLTCQRSDVDLVSVGDAAEAEKDRLLEKVRLRPAGTAARCGLQLCVCVCMLVSTLPSRPGTRLVWLFPQ